MRVLFLQWPHVMDGGTENMKKKKPARRQSTTVLLKM